MQPTTYLQQGRFRPTRLARLSTLWLALALLLAGCTTLPPTPQDLQLPEGYERTTSSALANAERTKLGRFFQAELTAHPGKSGVVLLSSGETALRTRIDLANMANKTLDLQYYIWEGDTTGKILAERVLRAADRGVRVRLLIDDINTADTDFGFARMDRHPNIELRLFNPFVSRGVRGVDFAFDFSRVNHRMHNKVFVADNAFAVVGGRNIGDDYFGVDRVANFRDLDLLAVGPVVEDISRGFDQFWNSEWSVPITALIPKAESALEYERRKARLYRWAARLKDFPYPIDTDSKDLYAQLEAFRGRFIWADTEVLYDAPDKLESGEEGLADDLKEVGQSKQHEIVLEAAYFIMRPDYLESARRNKEQGIRQRVLTNSLATNDVAAAHAGYAEHRETLIRSGVELYELRPDATSDRKYWSLLAGSSRASLHTKAAVVDRRKVIIGSFNMDPRSAAINTEVVLVVDSPELAKQVLDYMDQEATLENSYHVVLETDEYGHERLVWITKKNGKIVKYYSEPDTGWWRRFSSWFMSLLPIEDQL